VLNRDLLKITPFRTARPDRLVPARTFWSFFVWRSDASSGLSIATKTLAMLASTIARISPESSARSTDASVKSVIGSPCRFCQAITSESNAAIAFLLPIRLPSSMNAIRTPRARRASNSARTCRCQGRPGCPIGFRVFSGRSRPRVSRVGSVRSVCWPASPSEPVGAAPAIMSGEWQSSDRWSKGL
jgi:hypothetical protein